MALAGAPRLILFDEPAAGLSPGERRELVLLLQASAAAHGLRADRARPRRRPAGGRARDGHAQRPRAQARHAGRDRERRRRAGDLSGQRPWPTTERTGSAGPCSRCDDLDVYYGHAHALQGVSLRIERGVLAVVGRNGMGKTTLCNAITGLVPARGSVKLLGEEIPGLPPNRITDQGHRLRAAGAARVAFAHGRRASAPGGAGARVAGPGPSSGCTDRSRGWPIGAKATAAHSSPAASSRCWRSRAPCCSTPSCW